MQAIKDAKAEIEARAAERFAHEQAEYEAKVKARKDKQKRTGKKPRGKPPTPPASAPSTKDQVNLTDADSRIMPAPGGGFEQSYKRPSGGGHQYDARHRAHDHSSRQR